MPPHSCSLQQHASQAFSAFPCLVGGLSGCCSSLPWVSLPIIFPGSSAAQSNARLQGSGCQPIKWELGPQNGMHEANTGEPGQKEQNSPNTDAGAYSRTRVTTQQTRGRGSFAEVITGLSGMMWGEEGRGLLARFDLRTSVAREQPSPVKAEWEGVSSRSSALPCAEPCCPKAWAYRAGMAKAEQPAWIGKGKALRKGRKWCFLPDRVLHGSLRSFPTPLARYSELGFSSCAWGVGST